MVDKWLNNLSSFVLQSIATMYNYQQDTVESTYVVGHYFWMIYQDSAVNSNINKSKFQVTVM